MHKRQGIRFKKTAKLLAAFIISLPVLLAGITTHPQSASANNFDTQVGEHPDAECNTMPINGNPNFGYADPCPEPEPEPEPYPYDPYTRDLDDLEQCLDWSGDHPILVACPDSTPQDPSELCYEPIYVVGVTLYRTVPCAYPEPLGPPVPDDSGSDEDDTDPDSVPRPESLPVILDFNSVTKHTFSTLSANAALFGYSQCPNGAISYGRECGSGTIFSFNVPGDVSGNRAEEICIAADNRARNLVGFREYSHLIDLEKAPERRFSDNAIKNFEGYFNAEYDVNTYGDRVMYDHKPGVGDCRTRTHDALIKSAFPEGQAGSLNGFTELADSLKDTSPADRRYAVVSVRTFCPSNEALVGVDVQKTGEMIKYHHLWRDRNQEDIELLTKGLEHDSFRVCVFDRILLENHLRGLGKTDADVAADLQSFDDLVYGRPTYVYVAPNPLPDVEPPEPPAVEPVDTCETDLLVDCPPHLIVKVPGWFWFASDSSNPTRRLPVTGQPFTYVDGDDPTGQSINSPIEFGFGAELFDGHPDPNYEYFDNEGPALHTLVGLNSRLSRELNYSISVGHMGGRFDVYAEIDTANAPAREWHHIKYSVSEETQDRIDMGEFTISFDPPETIITVCNRYLYPDCWAQLPDEPPLPPPPTTTTTTIPRIDRSSMHTTRDEVSINVAESVRTGATTRVEFLANDQCRVAASSADRCTGSRPTIHTQPSEGTASIVAGGLGGWQLEYTSHAWAGGQDIVEYVVVADGSDYSEIISIRFNDSSPDIPLNNQVGARKVPHPTRRVLVHPDPHIVPMNHYV